MIGSAYFCLPFIAVILRRQTARADGLWKTNPVRSTGSLVLPSRLHSGRVSLRRARRVVAIFCSYLRDPRFFVVDPSAPPSRSAVHAVQLEDGPRLTRSRGVRGAEEMRSRRGNCRKLDGSGHTNDPAKRFRLLPRNLTVIPSFTRSPRPCDESHGGKGSVKNSSLSDSRVLCVPGGSF